MSELFTLTLNSYQIRWAWSLSRIFSDEQIVRVLTNSQTSVELDFHSSICNIFPNLLTQPAFVSPRSRTLHWGLQQVDVPAEGDAGGGPSGVSWWHRAHFHSVLRGAHALCRLLQRRDVGVHAHCHAQHHHGGQKAARWESSFVLWYFSCLSR